MKSIRLVLPFHLQRLAGVGPDVTVNVEGVITQDSVLTALEAEYPTLRGTIRDHTTRRRRPFLRFFACGVDLSNEPMDAPLPDQVSDGTEQYLIVGAIAGG